MRILYPLLWSVPGRQACRQQTVSTVAALARHGHALTLLMPRRRQDPKLTARDLREYFGVEGDFRLVQRRSRWSGEGLLSSLMWLRQVFRDPEAGSADLLYSRIPAMLGAGHLSPLPYATDHYRLWPDDLPAIRPLLRRTARHPYCAGLVLHSDYAAQAYRRMGIDPNRILVAHNGFDPPAPPLDRASARAALGLPQGRPISVYAGRINDEKGLDQILALADLKPDVLFLLVGSEGEGGSIERQATGFENVRILPWADPASLPTWLAAADVLLIPASSAPLERFRSCVLPMKLFSYLNAARPILAPLAPDTAELLQQEETALLVPPDRPEATAAALDRLLREPGLNDRLGANASRLAEGLTWDRRAEKISAFLQKRLLAIGEGRRRGQRSPYRSTVTPISATMTGAAQAPTAAGK